MINPSNNQNKGVRQKPASSNRMEIDRKRYERRLCSSSSGRKALNTRATIQIHTTQRFLVREHLFRVRKSLAQYCGGWIVLKYAFCVDFGYEDVPICLYMGHRCCL